MDTKPLSKGFIWVPIPVSESFRSEVLRRYPALEDDLYRRLAEYFMFSFAFDKEKQEEGEIVCRKIAPANTIKKLLRLPTRTNVGKILDAFNRDVWRIDPSSYAPSHGRARTVMPYPDDIGELIPYSLYNMPDSQSEPMPSLVSCSEIRHVDFFTGKNANFNRYLTRKIKEYESVMIDPVSEDDHRYDLFNLLNSAKPHALNKKVISNFDDAWNLGCTLPRGTRDYTCYFLRHIRASSLPTYSQVERSDRLFVKSCSVNGLPREVRHVLLRGKGTVFLDVKACQLAINAKLWDTPILSKILADPNQNFWNHILTRLKLSPEYKPAIKEATFAMSYGGSHSTMKDILLYAGLNDKQVKAFFSIPAIAEMKRAAKQKRSEVQAEGGYYDAFDRWLPLTTKDHAGGLLARVAQSWEMKLMLPLVPVLQDQREKYGVSILSWLHDGFAIHVPKAREIPTVIRQLKAAFKQNAEALGVQTELVVES